MLFFLSISPHTIYLHLYNIIQSTTLVVSQMEKWHLTLFEVFIFLISY